MTSASARPLAQVLRQFAARTGARSVADAPDAVEAQLRAEYDRGRAEALDEAQRRLDAFESEAGERLLRALAEARALWARAEGEALAARIASAFGQLDEELEEGVASALRPLAGAAAAREAARIMAAELVRAMGADDAGPAEASIEIAAPPDLAQAIRDALSADVEGGARALERLSFVESAGSDAVARLGRLRVETRLAGLAGALASGMAKGPAAGPGAES